MMCLTFAVYSFQVTLDPLQSLQFTETESAPELFYIPFVDFFIKSLHFFGKFIANTTNLDNDQPLFHRWDISFDSRTVESREDAGAQFPMMLARMKEQIRHVPLALYFKIIFRLTARAFELALTFSFN